VSGDQPDQPVRRRTRRPEVDDEYEPPAIEGPQPKFNDRLAVRITEVVGSMWCAYAFVFLALISLPSALASGSTVVVVAWISQTFLQLVLLSIIMVGQNVQARASDKRAEATYEDANTVLYQALQIQEHLKAQDALLQATRDFQERLDAQDEVLAALRKLVRERGAD
jgi:hypothetical protein